MKKFLWVLLKGLVAFLEAAFFFIILVLFALMLAMGGN